MILPPIKCADSAFPEGLRPFPAGFQCAQFYIGERAPVKTPTPHMWSKQDVNGLPKGIGRYPMFVGTPAIGGNPSDGDVDKELMECVHALHDVGAPRGCVVGLDFETAVNPRYVNRFYSGMLWLGHPFRVWLYGSESFVTKNPPMDGYDIALYDGKATFAGIRHERAKQYADSNMLHTSYDARIIHRWQYQRHVWKS